MSSNNPIIVFRGASNLSFWICCYNIVAASLFAALIGGNIQAQNVGRTAVLAALAIPAIVGLQWMAFRLSKIVVFDTSACRVAVFSAFARSDHSSARWMPVRATDVVVDRSRGERVRITIRTSGQELRLGWVSSQEFEALKSCGMAEPDVG